MSCVDSIFETLGEKAVQLTKKIVKSGCKLVTKTAQLSFNACKVGLQGLNSLFQLMKTGFENLGRNLAVDVVNCEQYKTFKNVIELQKANYELIRKNHERITISDNLTQEELLYLQEDIRNILYIEAQTVNERKLYQEILSEDLMMLGHKIIKADLGCLDICESKKVLKDIKNFFEILKEKEDQAVALVYALKNKKFDNSLTINMDVVESSYKELRRIVSNLEDRIGTCQNKIFREELSTYTINREKETSVVVESEKIKIKR